MAKLGLQLFTVKDELEKDFPGTLRKVAEMGYEGVEFAGGLLDAADAREVKQVLDETGLEAAGAVFPMHELESRMEEIIAYCREIGCAMAVFPWINDEFRTAEGYREIGRRLNAFGRTLKGHGIGFLYHIHGYEFEDLGGTTGMDILSEVLETEYVGLEIDVYWVEWAGVDAVAFMEKYGCLSPYIHFKDMRDRGGKQDIEVGDGAIDMVAVAREGKRNRAAWFLVEQEKFDRPTLESASISLRNLKRIDSLA